ncbi:MAG: gamma-glutamyltransferase, partial [Myxococcales bacterium]|nr:gamma-glutamyltransferase [Myxococcales bacterium]
SATEVTAPRAPAEPTASAAPAAPPRRLAAGGKAAVAGEHGMVASEDAEATRAGVAILAAGGNAIDAAIAVAYALAVTHHSAGGLGGGGFMIVHLASGETVAIDYREIAPAKATVKLNEKQLAAGAHGYLSAPVPGVVAGLELARERFGSLDREALLAPAIRLAKEGFAYGPRQSLVLNWYWERLKRDRGLRSLFRRKGDKPIQAGQRLVQPDLAATLEAIAAEGKAGFYAGAVAKKLAKAHAKGGGLVTEEDLAAYEAKIREPLRLRYGDFDVVTMPPPSMGGIAVAGILQSLAAAKAAEAEPGSALGQHLFLEAARRAYADRRSVGADPDRMDPAVVGPRLAKLFDPAYYAGREPAIDPQHATPSSAIVPLVEQGAEPSESPDTTHFSVVDAQGNAVACTTTLSAAFGAWVLVPGVGILLSNAMGAFSPEGVNVLEPHKRMASSMSPTLLVQQGKAVAVVGSPGGDTIPGTVAQVLRNLIDEKMTVDAAVEAPRIHHQFRPDEVRSETKRPLPAPIRQALEKRGHVFKPSPAVLGDVNAIVVDVEHGVAYGHADERKGGLAAGPP